MADAGDNPPPATDTGDEAAAATAEEHAADAEETGVKIEEVASTMAKRSTLRPQMSFIDDQERVDVDRTALEAILDVSSRLTDIQKKSRMPMSTLAFANESYKDKQVNNA